MPTDRRGGFWGRVPGALSLLTGAMFVAILLILVIGQGAFSFAYENSSALTNLALLPVALLAALLWAFVCARGKAPSDRRDLWIILGFQLALLVVQLVVTRSLWFYAGWDVGVVDAVAVRLAQGVPLNNAGYYTYCPNNAPLTVLLSLPAWVGVKLGLAVPYGVLPYFCACVHNLTGLLTALCARKLFASRRALYAALAVQTLWVGLHLYMTVPYTDVFGAFFAALALYILLSKLRPFAKTALFSFACFFGASLKPPVAILFIAAAILAVAKALACERKDAAWRRRALAALAAAVIGFAPARLWQSATTAYLAGSANPEGTLSVTHYFMIGQNDDSWGGHSQSDLELSRSIETLAERQSVNLERGLGRIRDRGLWGNLRFYAVKAYKAYADGTFAANSSVLMNQKNKREDALSEAARAVFYGEGELNGAYHTVEQTVWLAVLLLCAYAALRARKSRPFVPLLALSILGLTLYQLLMEVWPRYLYIFWPAFLLLAATGAQELGLLTRKDSARLDTPPQR